MLSGADRGNVSLPFPFEPKFSDYEPVVQDGLRELIKAYEFAVDTNRDRWDFAVELRVLRRFGLTESHFRWLVCKGIVEHAVEVAATVHDQRKFRQTNVLKFKKHSCFVLTSDFAAKLMGREVTVIALHPEQQTRVHMKLASYATATIQAPTTTAQHACDRLKLMPQWDGGRRELFLADLLVKKFRWPAKNQETVLAAFAEEQWPHSGVDDPLPQHPDKDPKQRLRDTIKCLNRSQEHRFIHFRGDGTGERVIWEYTPKALELLGVDRSTIWRA